MKYNLLLTTGLFLFLSIMSVQAAQSIPAGEGEEPDAKMSMDQKRVDVGTDFSIHFTNAPVGVNAWIGI